MSRQRVYQAQAFGNSKGMLFKNLQDAHAKYLSYGKNHSFRSVETLRNVSAAIKKNGTFVHEYRNEHYTIIERVIW